MIDKSIKPETYKGQYRMHKYWAKKPHNIICEFIKEFTKEGDVVLDPFCGSGVTISEALKMKRLPIGIDLNPVATFIAEQVVKPVDVSSLESEFEKIKTDIKSEINEMYQMNCNCGEKVVVTHTIWKNDEPIEIWYTCDKCGKVKKNPTPQEKKMIQQARNRCPDYWVPETELIPNSRISVKKGDTIKDFFTPRNLACLSILWNRIEKIQDKELRDTFKFIFTGSVHQASKMVFVINRKGRKTLGSWVAGYWIPNEHFEVNVWRFFNNGFKRVLKGKKQIAREIRRAKLVNSIDELRKTENSFILKPSDAKHINFIPDGEVDYILTDPPYGDSHPYFEQSMLWAAWLNKKLDFEEEIVISDSKDREKNLEDYSNGLKEALREMSRVLKKRGYASIAFNNIGSEEWNAFVKAYNNAGFQFIDAFSIKASAGSVKQDSRENSLKGHFIITLRKTSRRNRLGENKESEIVSFAKEILKDKGPLETFELYDYLIIEMLRKNKVNTTGKSLLEIFKENLEKDNGKWNYP